MAINKLKDVTFYELRQGISHIVPTNLFMVNEFLNRRTVNIQQAIRTHIKMESRTRSAHCGISVKSQYFNKFFQICPVVFAAPHKLLTLRNTNLIFLVDESSRGRYPEETELSNRK